MRISEASKACGLSEATIRQYEANGLLQPVPRSPGGLREYDAEHVARLTLIRRLRAFEVPLPDIRQAIGSGDRALAARRAILGRLSQAAEEVRDLSSLLEAGKAI